MAGPSSIPSPSPAPDWLLLALLGIFGTAAHLVITFALRFAPSSTLAPMQYLELPFATLIGWPIFGDLPDGLAALGIAVTVAAGLYVIHRERRSQPRPLAPRPPAHDLSPASVRRRRCEDSPREPAKATHCVAPVVGRSA